MTAAGWIEILLFCVVLTALTPVLGGYMARVFRGEAIVLARLLGPVERLVYRGLRVDAARGQDWKGYARSVLVFSVVSAVALYVVLRTQGIHPFNPQNLGPPTWDLSFNTAASFVSNTNWQFYGGETTMSYFSQMAGLAVQNFVSAGVGIAVVIAFIRGIASRSGREIGVFYVDLTRAMLYVLLPISVIVGLVLVSQGVLQNLSAYVHTTGLTGAEQVFANGPVASQEAIKELGTNGGGFFNVNSAMPFENPTWLSNFVEMLVILAIPAGLTATYGRMVDNRRQGWMVFGAMMTLFVVAVAVIYISETGPTAAMHAAGLTGDNLEGKEQRFGIGSTALFTAVTTAASCGAVNGAMEALSGLGGAVPMAQMMTGEVVWGGVGSGLYSMLLFVILGVFISGLMVGRTPEFLGKKIEAREIKLTVIGSIAVPMMVLATTALAIATKWGKPSIFDSGPQGFSETLYAYASQGNNNGSAFAGYTGYLQPNGTNAGAFGISFGDVLGGFAMLGGRFLPMLVVLAVAGSLAGKRVSPPGLGTLRTDTPTFAVVLISVVLIVALLTFVPALLLGPIVQGLTNQLF
jgi:K+-transporting ATPase ATPase A chain